MKAGHVVYVDSNPSNIVGLFFQQNFPAGKTSLEAAQAFQATLIDAGSAVVPSDVRAIEIDDYQLLQSSDINL